MKELQGHASNLLIADKGGETPSVIVELILITSEPRYISDGGNGMTRIRKLEDFRVTTGIDQLRKFTKILIELADEAEALQGRVKIAPEKGQGELL